MCARTAAVGVVVAAVAASSACALPRAPGIVQRRRQRPALVVRSRMLTHPRQRHEPRRRTIHVNRLSMAPSMLERQWVPYRNVRQIQYANARAMNEDIISKYLPARALSQVAAALEFYGTILMCG